MARLKNEARIRKLVTDRARQLDVGRAAYAEADKLLGLLRKTGWKPGQPIPLPGEREAELVDHFAEKDKHFKTTVFSRFDVTIAQK